jgi:hypothetical protein
MNHMIHRMYFPALVAISTLYSGSIVYYMMSDCKKQNNIMNQNKKQLNIQ